MSHAHSHTNTVPRPALVMAGLLVVITLALTGLVRTGLLPREAVPAAARGAAGATATASRNLAFADRADGAVVVTDVDRHAVLAVLRGENDGGGFVRGVMRGMARERKMHAIGAAPPFTLTRWSDGGLTLRDPATGRAIELGSFGETNRAAFARFLAEPTA
ncbi:MAG: phosphonoacetaldehyde methylase [Sphingomonadales bacterium]|nr:phosphonoacetaldehyde methylase [Sphingomonadales bacterium]